MIGQACRSGHPGAGFRHRPRQDAADPGRATLVQDRQIVERGAGPVAFRQFLGRQRNVGGPAPAKTRCRVGRTVIQPDLDANSDEPAADLFRTDPVAERRVQARDFGECGTVLVALGQFLDGNVRRARLMKLGDLRPSTGGAQAEG